LGIDNRDADRTASGVPLLVHDIHMNQGNSGAFGRDDGVWQDGGLLMHFPGESRWVAVFLAFQAGPGTPMTAPGTPSTSRTRWRAAFASWRRW